ncbi:guanylate cyclase [Elysia marginata]|uniref:Guanylate cyclase n=1 Tax=Elysia marginata TaxID=1093978 RepID=A0AAV4EXP8_9GAST|nr:guanylate cyclase [Elysia marginata]
MNFVVLPYPSYSPDLAPSDFYLFPKLKEHLRGNHYKRDEDVEAAEGRKTDSLLYQMVPRSVAEKMKMKKDVDAEYFKSVTILLSEIMGFNKICYKMCTDYPANDILILLNKIFTAIDGHLENHDVYKVETINDCYMVASGTRPSEIRKQIAQIYGEGAMSKSRAYQWCTWFGEGRTSLDNEPKSGRPKTWTDEENKTLVDELIKCERRMKIRETF